MRVTYIHQYFSTPNMVGGTRSFEMAKRLVAWGHEVHIITSKGTSLIGERSAGQWLHTLEDGIHVHWAHVPYSNHMSYGKRVQAFFRFSLAASLKAASIPADVILATSTPLTIAIPGVYASRRQKAPMVFEVRDLWPAVPIALGILPGPLAWVAGRLELFAYRNASRIITLSPGMRDGVVRTGYPESRVSIIPNAADLHLFRTPTLIAKAAIFRQKYDWLQDRPLVVYTGAIGYVNDVGYLARLAAHVWDLDHDIRFLVVGEGREKDALRELARFLNVLNRNFYMMDSVPRSEVAEIIAAATVATSLVRNVKALWDNSANKFFDALAAGKPIAINYGGWQADLLQNTGAGILLSPTDVQAAAVVLLGVLRNQNWLDLAATASGALAIDRFSRDRLAFELMQVLLGAVSEGQVAGAGT